MRRSSKTWQVSLIALLGILGAIYVVILVFTPPEPLTLSTVQEQRTLETEAARQGDELLGEGPVTRREAQFEPGLEPDSVIEPPSDLEVFLAANPGSPLGLLPSERAELYLGTEESLRIWTSSVDELAGRDTSQVDMELWQLCREHMALRYFIVGYQGRERARWASHEHSISLETELQPALGFIQAHYGDDAELWRLINAYSTEVVDQIHGEGEYANRDDVQSRWDLHSALVHAGEPAFDAVVAIILGDTR